MKKYCFVLVLFILFLCECLFSCKNDIKTYTLKINIWDSVNNKYIESEQKVKYGSKLSEIMTAPISFEKEGTTYTFDCWIECKEIPNKILVDDDSYGNPVSEDKIITDGKLYYIPRYKTSVSSYTLKFNIWDNENNKYKESEKTVSHGSVFSAIKPTVESFDKDGKTYTFSGWVERNLSSSSILDNNAGVSVDDSLIVTSSKTYFAKYNSNTISYTLKFNIWDNENNKYKESEKNVSHGSVFGEIKPTVDSFDKDGKTYTFSGWVERNLSSSSILDNNAGVSVDDSLIVTSSKTYFAKYNSNTISYTLKFNIWDRENNKYKESEKNVSHGSVFSEVKPTVESFDKDGKTYTFSGWVERSEESSSILDNNAGVSVDDSLIVTSSKTYFAKYNSSTISYTLKFNIWDKENNKYKESEKTVSHGSVFSAIKPEVESFKQGGLTYTFSGWVERNLSPNSILDNNAGVSVSDSLIITSSKTYFAKYNSSTISYTLKFNIWDKENNKYKESEKTVSHGSVFSAIKPTVESFDKDGKRYNFSGWVERNLSSSTILDNNAGVSVADSLIVTSSKTYFAKYNSSTILYTLKFNIWDKENNKYKESEKSVSHGSVFSEVKPTVESFEKDGKTYTFSSWVERNLPSSSILDNNAGVSVADSLIITSSKTYFAKYNSAPIKYTIKFITYNSSTGLYNSIETKEVDHSTKINAISVSHQDIIENNITHHFLGWTRSENQNGKLIIDQDVLSNETSILKNETFYAVYDTYDSNIQKITVTNKDNLTQLTTTERNNILSNATLNTSYTKFALEYFDSNCDRIYQASTLENIDYKSDSYRTTILINNSGTRYTIFENESLSSSNNLPQYIIQNILSIIQQNGYKNYVYDSYRDCFVCVYNKNKSETGDGTFLYKKLYVKNRLLYKIVVSFNPEFLNNTQNSQYINSFNNKYKERPIAGKEYEILNLDTNINSALINNNNLEFINKSGKQISNINVSINNNNIVVDTGSESGDLYLVISNSSTSSETAPNIKGYENDMSSVLRNTLSPLNANIVSDTSQSPKKGHYYDKVINVEIDNINDNLNTDNNTRIKNNILLNTTSLTQTPSKYASVNVGDSITLHSGYLPDTPGLWVYEGKNDNNPYQPFKKVNVTLREKRTVFTKQGNKTLLIFVEDDMWGSKGAKINQSFVTSQADAFLRDGLDNDIYDWMTTVFNSEWSDFSSSLDANSVQTINRKKGTNSPHGLYIDNYDEIVVLYADIYGQGPSSADGGVVGYYTNVNNYIGEFNLKSNEAVMLTLNAYFCKENSKEGFLTLAHEFQHAIYFHHRVAKKGYSVSSSGSVSYKNIQSTWINEMCSALAEEIMAKKLEVNGPSNTDKSSGDYPYWYNPKDLEYGRIVEYIGGSRYDVTDWDKVSIIDSLYPYGLVYSLGGYLLRNIDTSFIKKIYSTDLLEKNYSQGRQRDFLLNVVNSANNTSYTWSDILRMWGASVLMSNNYSAPKNYVYSKKNGFEDYWFKNLFNIEFKIPSNNYHVYKNEKSLKSAMWEGGEALSTTGPYIFNQKSDRPYKNLVNKSINANTNTYVLLAKGVSGKKIYNIDVSDFNTSKLKFTFVKK